jgi:predicted Zn-dependent peptidase
MARLLRTMARTAAISGTATAASGRVRQRQAQQFANQAAGEVATPAPAAEANLDQQIAQLEKLAKLKEQGIVTQEEFDAKKKQILGI